MTGVEQKRNKRKDNQKKNHEITTRRSKNNSKFIARQYSHKTAVRESSRVMGERGGEREREKYREAETEKDKTTVRHDRKIRQGDNTAQDSTLQYNAIPYHTQHHTIQTQKSNKDILISHY
jgi:hypothetical protein